MQSVLIFISQDSNIIFSLLELACSSSADVELVCTTSLSENDPSWEDSLSTAKSLFGLSCLFFVVLEQYEERHQ